MLIVGVGAATCTRTPAVGGRGGGGVEEDSSEWMGGGGGGGHLLVWEVGVFVDLAIDGT